MRLYLSIAFTSLLVGSSFDLNARVQAWVLAPPTTIRSSGRQPSLCLRAKAGSFFNSVPKNNDDEADNDNNEPASTEERLMEIIRKNKAPSLASQPSTINGKPTAGQGFGRPAKSGGSKPYIAVGTPEPRVLNDPTKPEYDDQGYTLYADEKTGEKSRVFEALVNYPCDFTLKIVGASEGGFVPDMVALVAESCEVGVETLSDKYSVRAVGKWTSVTVHAPVQSADMLYRLYENVDRDPRVRFKF